MADYALALRHGEELRAEAEEGAGGDLELDPRARALRLHFDELALAAGENPDDRRGEPFGDVDDEVLEGLVLLAFDLAHDDPGAPT